VGVGNLPGMSEPSLSCITIYQLRVVPCGVSPLVWRRLLVASDTTIAELHEIFQSAFDWSGEHLHRFLSVFGRVRVEKAAFAKTVRRCMAIAILRIVLLKMGVYSTH
jgi:hypothetical protein